MGTHDIFSLEVKALNTSEFLTITNLIVPERTAIIFENTKTTFEELQDKLNMLANAMSDL